MTIYQAFLTFDDTDIFYGIGQLWIFVIFDNYGFWGGRQHSNENISSGHRSQVKELAMDKAETISSAKSTTQY